MGKKTSSWLARVIEAAFMRTLFERCKEGRGKNLSGGPAASGFGRCEIEEKLNHISPSVGRRGRKSKTKSEEKMS